VSTVGMSNIFLAPSPTPIINPPLVQSKSLIS